MHHFVTLFWSSTIDGITIGAIYALVALGYTLVYGVLQLINFAHSEVFMVGTFASLFTLHGLGVTGPQTGLALVGVLLLCGLAAMAGSATTAFLLERVAYRPLRRRTTSRLAALISAIGASFFIQEVFAVRYGRDIMPFPRIMDKTVLFHIGSGEVRTDKVLVVGAAIVMMILLDRFVGTSRLGRGIRATAQDPEMAVLMGVNIDRVVVMTFILGGLMAGVAALLFGHLLRGHPVQHRLPARHQGLHRRRAGRDRQPQGRARGRLRPRPHRGLRGQHLRGPMEGRDRLRGPGPGPPGPAHGPAGRAAGEKQDMRVLRRASTPKPDDSGARRAQPRLLDRPRRRVEAIRASLARRRATVVAWRAGLPDVRVRSPSGGTAFPAGAGGASVSGSSCWPCWLRPTR